MSSLRPATILLVLLSVEATVRPLHAAEPPANGRSHDHDVDTSEAERHFTQAVTLYEDGDYSAALFEFERAYAIILDHRLLYNIGVVQWKLRDYAGARQSFREYLERSGDDLDSARRKEVETQLETIESRVGTLSVRCELEGAEVRVDGELVGVTPIEQELWLNIGRHNIQVTAEGHRPYRTQVAITGGQEVIVDAELVTLPVQSPSAPVARAVPPEKPGDRRDRPDLRSRRFEIASIVGLGATAALGIGTIVTGVLALRANRDLARELGRYPAEPAVVRRASDRRRTLALTTDGLIGATAAVAAITLGTGITALVRRKKDSTTSSLRVKMTFDGLAVSF